MMEHRYVCVCVSECVQTNAGTAAGVSKVWQGLLAVWCGLAVRCINYHPSATQTNCSHFYKGTIDPKIATPD